MVQDEVPAFISLISSDILPSPGSHITAPKLPQLTLDHESEPGASDSLPSPTYDGGRQAWLSLFGGFCAMTGVFGYVNAFGVYQDRYVRENVTSASGASWIGSVQVFLLIGTGFFTGPLVDRGYFRIMFFSGSILYLFSLFVLSIADITRYYQLILAQGFGMGLGAGCIYIPTIVVQSHHWKKYRPVAIGLIFSGSSLGAIVFSTMLNQLLRNGTSFGWAVRASAFVVLALLAIANVCISPRRFDAIQNHSDEPVTSYRALFLDLPYMLANIGAFLTILCTFYPYFYIELYAISHGVNSNIAFYMVAILNAASIPGRVLPSVCALRFGTFNVLIFCTLCFAATTFSLFRISSLAEITVYTILAGFFTGAIFSLLAAAVVKFARSHAEAGRRAGLSFAMGACGSLIGNPINGALLGSTLQWNKTFIFIGVMTLVATAFLTAARQIVVKNGSSQII